MKLVNVAMIALASVALTAGCTKKEEAAPAAPAEVAAPVEMAPVDASAAPVDGSAAPVEGTPADATAPTPTPTM